MHFSLIQYRDTTDPDPRTYTFGLILFRDDRAFLSKVFSSNLDYARVPNPDVQRMGANAIINRLKESAPKSLEDVETFRSKESNEIQISVPRPVEDHVLLDRLADLYVH